VSPEPLKDTVAHPVIDVPPSRKLMVPVGALPLIVAVKVTLCPSTEGLAELDNVVLVAVPLTVCVSAALVEALLTESPLYVPDTLCVPGARLLVAQAAVYVLALLATGTALQPGTELPPSVKFTIPVGLLPATVAVKVTLAPSDEGLIELASDVLVAAPLTVCVSAALVEPLLIESPL
jgi:hypothetical protein